jgi:signal peptidase I, bacterial type
LACFNVNRNKKEASCIEEIREQSNHQERPNKPQQATTLLQDIVYLLLKITAIVAAVVLLFTFIFGVMRVTDIAMKPTVQDGDLVIFYRLDKEYVASDPVVLSYEGEKQIRRVVAVAGDTVDITEGGLVINGSLVQELDIREETLRFEDGISFPITIEEGQVFVLGDGRNDSVDSRLYGAVDINDTLGKVMTILRRRNI